MSWSNKRALLYPLFCIGLASPQAFSMDFSLDELLQDVKELKQSAEFGNGKYIQGGLYAQVVAGLNQHIALAALGKKNERKLGAYCVGGQVLATSAGVGVMGETGQTLGCNSIADYSGAFLSFIAGGRFLLGASVSYSIGLDIHALLNHLAQWLENSTPSERGKLKKDLANTLRFLSENDLSRPELDLLFMVINKLAPNLINEDDYQGIEERLSESTSELAASLDQNSSLPSLGGRIKKSLQEIEKYAIEAGPDNSQYAIKFLKGLSAFFTGCDSVGIGADAGISAGGGAAIQISDYVLLSTIDYRYIEKLDVGPSNLFNDRNEHKDVSYLTAIKEVGRFSKEIAKGAYRCSVAAQANTMTYVGQIKKISQKKYFTFERREMKND